MNFNDCAKTFEPFPYPRRLAGRRRKAREGHGGLASSTWNLAKSATRPIHMSIECLPPVVEGYLHVDVEQPFLPSAFSFSLRPLPDPTQPTSTSEAESTFSKYPSKTLLRTLPWKATRRVRNLRFHVLLRF